MFTKILLRLEEAAMAAIAIYFVTRLNLNLSWWTYVLLFLSPDISFIGFAINAKTGNVVYNIFHFKAIAIILCICGIILKMEYLTLVGLMMFAHASFDRLVGFNLRSNEEAELVKA